MARRTLLDTDGFNNCVRTREGYVLYNRNDYGVGQAIERYGEFSEDEARLLRQLCKPGDVVIEAGANIGAHTMVLARAAGPGGFVYAYEPQRILFQTLCANLALNSIVNVDARNAAAGSGPGHVLMPDIDYAQPNNFGALSMQSLQPAGDGRKVRVVSLDDDLELQRLNLMKVDVEGMELEVLRGATRLIERFRPVLYVENDRVPKSEALIGHLLGLGYRLYWDLPPLYNPDNFFGEKENLYPNLFSFNMLGLHRSAAQDVKGMPEITDPASRPRRIVAGGHPATGSR